ncbi:MAG: hypothetical protein VB133_07655 [Anaeromusa sp.]|uniref:hypothetical protein n=1 Tax=Anaeromusa sp. TaxID=1872520 RepID=UPI002B20B594|nr:hypothetical protein [Anaeromusa sp.]MEA4834992.1 hypothetical protein [Anaeromusa sp.]
MEQSFTSKMVELEKHYPKEITKAATEVGKLLNGFSISEANQVLNLVFERLTEMAILKMD